MSKTPEELAEEWLINNRVELMTNADAFIAGYEVAKEQYKVAIETYEDVAKQMLNEALRIMKPQKQFADVSVVIDHIPDTEKMVWISVNDRLPEIGEHVLVTHRTSQDYDSLQVMEAARLDEDQYEIWGGFAILADYVDYWMPLPEPPKHDK